MIHVPCVVSSVRKEPPGAGKQTWQSYHRPVSRALPYATQPHCNETVTTKPSVTTTDLLGAPAAGTVPPPAAARRHRRRGKTVKMRPRSEEIIGVMQHTDTECRPVVEHIWASKIYCEEFGILNVLKDSKHHKT